MSSLESGQNCSWRDGSGRRQICSGRAAGAGRAGPKLLSIAYAAGNAAAAVSLLVAGDAGGVTAAGGRASRCFAIRAQRPCLWRGSCSIQVQGCERRSKPPKHLTSSKRSSSCFCPLFFELGVPLVRLRPPTAQGCTLFSQTAGRSSGLRGLRIPCDFLPREESSVVRS